MTMPFEDRVVEAVRVVGPDATAAAVYGELTLDLGFWGTLFGPSMGRIMSRLESLREEGVLTGRKAADGRGRARRVYSMGTGRLREPGGRATWGTSASILALS